MRFGRIVSIYMLETWGFPMEKENKKGSLAERSISKTSIFSSVLDN